MHTLRFRKNLNAFAVAFAALLATFSARADLPEATAKALDKAIASEARPEADRSRDRNRMPVKTLEFFGLKGNMKVIEIFPGGGWYTKLLAPVLADDGQLIVAGGLGKALGFGGILDNEFPARDSVKIVDISDKLSAGERFGQLNMAPTSFGVRNADLVLTFRNMHNLNAAGRAQMLKASLKSLKKGGRLGIIDHTRRHMQDETNENWRRLDPVLVIKEATAAGFRFVDYANLHYRFDDELRYEVGRKSVRGNSDRFTLLFVKP
jgi:predicted methyltransferase